MPCARAATSASSITSGVVSESAAKMPPVCSQRTPFTAEEVVPVELARLELLSGGVPAVGHAQGAADAEAAFGEVQAVAHGAADAVVRYPAYERGVDAALEHEVLEQPADVVLDERGDDRGAHAEAPSQAACDVVFAAAFPDAKLAGGSNSPFAWVKPQHDLAERDEVVAACLGAAGL